MSATTLTNGERADLEQLELAVRTVYERQRGRTPLNPAWLATEAMATLGFTREMHPLGYLACHKTLCTIAEGICGSRRPRRSVAKIEQSPDPERLRTEAAALNRHADALRRERP